MKDIFDAKILCKNCNTEMKPIYIEKAGFRLRAVKCTNCGEKIVHPNDITSYQHFNDLRGKTYNVKMRIVGNSHAVSIPKEVAEFITETVNRMHESKQRIRKQIDGMVKLCFEDFGKLSLNFIDTEDKKW